MEDVKMNRPIAFLLSFTAIFTGVSSLNVLQLMVPHQVGRGHDAQLHCHFNLGNNTLYSVKWYKGSQEFFRFEPDGARSFQVFPHVSNLTVDVSRSNVTTVYLKNIQRKHAGTYRCEVSAEAHFETDFREANMTVIDLPVQGPIIINVQKSYQPGEKVLLNCTSSPSNPMAILYWSLDGEKVSELNITRYMDGSLKIKPEERRWNNVRESEIDLSDDNVAVVGLEYIIDLPNKQPSIGHFAQRVVSCTALVGDIYRSVSHSNLTIVDQRSPKAIATIRTPSHLLHSASGSWSNGHNKETLLFLAALFHFLFPITK